VLAPNSAAAAVDVYNAVDAAVAMHNLVKGFRHKNIITVDLQAGCVSYEQRSCCVLFSVGSTSRVQIVQVQGLPPSFIGVEQAQQVRRDARVKKPDQNNNAPKPSGTASSLKLAFARLSSSAC
jgi:hypothetical protein